MAVGLIAPTADASRYWTPYVSEEGGGPSAACTSWNEGAVGFGCKGRYCDNVRLLCETLPYGVVLDQGSDYWTGYFSEEHDQIAQWQSSGFYPWSNEQYRVCHASSAEGGIVNGVRCSGSYCDNISLECAQPVILEDGAWKALSMTNCLWSSWYSEEQGSVDFGFLRYITGVECQGSYCDNKRFYVCHIDPNS